LIELVVLIARAGLMKQAGMAPHKLISKSAQSMENIPPIPSAVF
jgi:hypothetical protein